MQMVVLQRSSLHAGALPYPEVWDVEGEAPAFLLAGALGQSNKNLFSTQSFCSCRSCLSLIEDAPP